MKCRKCGTELESNALVCPSCGEVVPDEDRLPEHYGRNELTKKEFLELAAMKPCKDNIIACGIALYVLGVINFIYWLVKGSLPLDGIFLILLGLGIHLGKSFICAIVCTIYSIYGMVIMFVSTGKITGWWILLVGINAIIYTYKYYNAWNQYKKDGTMPVEKDKK